MAQSNNRTVKPAAADRVFAAELVDRLGLAKAAAELKLSKLATLNLVSGGGCYASTLQRVQHARSRIVA